MFIALAETIEEFAIPVDPLIDLLVAFRQDQRVTRYETLDQLLELLPLLGQPGRPAGALPGRCHDESRWRLADSICTGLQLANFCQDVARDWDRGRIYLPQTHCRRFGYDEAMFARHEYNEAFRHLLAAEVDEAEGWLRRGLPLVKHGSERVCGSPWPCSSTAAWRSSRPSAQADYDVWSSRPVLSKWEKLRLASLLVAAAPGHAHPAGEEPP